MTFRKILVPLDGSANSEKVLGSIAGLARELKAALVLLAVTAAGKDRTEQHFAGKAGLSAEKYLDDTGVKLSQHGLAVSAVVEPGAPADVILKVARGEGADLVAMATHRQSAIARNVLGSVTDRVLRNAKLPVLAINPAGTAESPDTPWNPSTIIVPLDGSDLAEESVPTAIELAKGCDAELIFVQAIHVPSFAVTGPGGETYGTDYGIAAQEDSAREYLAQFIEMAESAGLRARGHVTVGNVAARIIEDSRKEKDAIIVISSHGRGGFKRAVLGSVADQIVRTSHHPVIVLKHSD